MDDTKDQALKRSGVTPPQYVRSPLTKNDGPESCATDEAQDHPPGWRPHAHYSIAVDFDGVIHSYISPWEGAHVIPDPPVLGAFEWLERMAQEFHIIIFSTRCLTPEGCIAVKSYLTKHHDGVYHPLYQRKMPWRQPGITPKVVDGFECTATKEAALIYLDDRAIRFDGSNFPSADDIQQALPWNKRAMNDSKHRI